jgi:SAM-dependent methyltransferase
MLRGLLQLPELKNWNYDIDAPETTELHGRIIQNKPYLKRLYTEWYTYFSRKTAGVPEGLKLEIGSGSGFIKQIIPDVITTDVLNLSSIDKIMSAEDLQFEDNSLSCIFMIDVLHHIPHPALFFDEASRCLKPGGMIVMIEPANSIWGRFIYQNFHHEPFNPTGTWEIPSTGPMSGANGALPWILLERDRKLFEQKYPHLLIKEIKYHSPLSYLLCGGVSMRSLLPGWSFGAVRFTERMLSGIFKQFSMFQTIEILKK